MPTNLIGLVSKCIVGSEAKTKILIVNDRSDQVTALRTVLEDLGINITTAASGGEALDRLREHEFAVVLLDVKMPGMDGFETANLIRQCEESLHTPIIFVSAYSQSDATLARSYAFGGVVDYIQTPIVPQILRAKVAVFVELFNKTKQVEQQRAELQKRVAELTDTNRELECFSYSLSHDLRAPVRAIHNFTKMVLEDSNQKLDASATDLLNRVVCSAERMERLMQDLLTLSQVSRRDIQLRPIDVENLVREIISHIPEWQTPEVEIKIAPPLLPMFGDEASLTQVISNLLSNAVKFVSPGVMPQVCIHSEAAGDKVRLWVEDNGIGIQREAHNKIFETFQRVPQNIHYEGEGIGLAIVHKAVDRMGGKVGLESESGKGSRFWIELRRATNESERTP